MSDASTQRRKLAAILMADVAGFSAMMGRDEERTTALIQEFHRRVDKIVQEHEGRVVDTAGDSVFGEFDSVVNAVRCAERIQEGQRAVNAEAAPEQRILTRIGVHLGDVIVENNRVYGDGVNIAARLEQLAEPGGILVSEAVYQQVHNKVERGFREEGLRELKNIQHPVRLYSLPALEARTRSETVIETRHRPPVPVPVRPPRSELAGPMTPVAGHAQPVTALQLWVDETMRAGVLMPVVAGFALLVSGIFGLPTGGALPAAGAVLLGTMLGHVWVRLTGKRGNRLIALGLAIAAGALLTNWSAVTNGLFLLGGLAVATSGLGMNYATASEQKPKPRRKQGRRRRADRGHSGRRRDTRRR